MALERPSVPHHLARPTTDRQRTTDRRTQDEAEAETVREPAAAGDTQFDEMLAIIRDPSGFSVESVLKLLSHAQRYSTAATRQADKLGVDLGVGRLQEQLGSVRESIAAISQGAAERRRVREWVAIALLCVMTAGAVGQALWNWVAPRAREAAEVAVIAPAIEAKRVAEVAVDRADDHEARISKMEKSQEEILGAIEKLNGAVVMVIDRLPDPEPTRIEVPRHGKRAGLDERRPGG